MYCFLKWLDRAVLTHKIKKALCSQLFSLKTLLVTIYQEKQEPLKVYKLSAHAKAGLIFQRLIGSNKLLKKSSNSIKTVIHTE